MRKIPTILVIAGMLTLALTMPALAARPTTVTGAAESDSVFMGHRTTAISARALPPGGAAGFVRVDRSDGVIIVQVRDLTVEDEYAYLMGRVVCDTIAPEVVGSWAYLAVYDGSAVGDVELVSHLWIADTYPGYEEILALFDGHYLFPEYPWFFMAVTSGNYRLLP